MPDTDPPFAAHADLPRLPRRAPDAHKGDAGRVAIIAGSCGMSGAAVLAARGALRGGAGLVKVVTSRSAQPIVAAAETCALTQPADEDASGLMSADSLDAWIEACRWASVVAMGPGLGQSEDIRRLVGIVLAEADKPLVIDADGLNAVSTVREWWTLRRQATVVTPHPGEMARLRKGAQLTEVREWDDETRLVAAAEYALLTRSVVVLKGRRTVICDGGGNHFINTSGNAGLATGGTGDVLTGLIAALIGQGMQPFDAARLGVYCHGAAADLLARTVGPIGFLARDIPEVLPQILAKHIAD